MPVPHVPNYDDIFVTTKNKCYVRLSISYVVFSTSYVQLHMCYVEINKSYLELLSPMWDLLLRGTWCLIFKSYVGHCFMHMT